MSGPGEPAGASRASAAGQDAFCAVALLLGLSPAEVAAALPAMPPGWLGRHAAARSSAERAAVLAPKLLALRVAVEGARPRWR